MGIMVYIPYMGNAGIISSTVVHLLGGSLKGSLKGSFNGSIKVLEGGVWDLVSQVRST